MKMPDTPVSSALIAAARELSSRVSTLTFAPPVSHVYNPLTYAWATHEAYLRRYAASPRRVVFLGMNPGPFGMVQNGVPFGDLAAVRDWLGIVAEVQKPATENPARPIEGFACSRSEVSGRRLWGLFRERFGKPEVFFNEHFVANYCPLAFFAQGRNLTPDKLSLAEAMPLQAACDAHLKTMVSVLQPEWVIGVGAFAVVRAAEALAGSGTRIGRVLHPSPASPLANRGWAEAATRQLVALGVWV
jgi:single-strand selective monofunctional uracil DNA glycosylase